MVMNYSHAQVQGEWSEDGVETNVQTEAIAFCGQWQLSHTVVTAAALS